MMIKGIENLDIIKFIGDKMINLTEGHFGGAVFSTMWISAAFTSIIGNVANAATFSKIINIMTPTFSGVVGVKVLWWALSFGSCLGGNLSLLGSATNVVAVGAADEPAVGCAARGTRPVAGDPRLRPGGAGQARSLGTGRDGPLRQCAG